MKEVTHPKWCWTNQTPKHRTLTWWWCELLSSTSQITMYNFHIFIHIHRSAHVLPYSLAASHFWWIKSHTKCLRLHCAQKFKFENCRVIVIVICYCKCLCKLFLRFSISIDEMHQFYGFTHGFSFVKWNFTPLNTCHSW